MSAEKRPFVWEMVKEAAEKLGGSTTNVAVRDWILQKYPDTNLNTIQCQIIVCTVNHASRIHYQENKKPRIANGQYDFIFRPERGRIEPYDPECHGNWHIYEREDGGMAVGLVDEPEPPSGNGFAAEAHLRDYLVQHLEQVEQGLQLYVNDNGDTGVEYQTPIGRIDILATDVKCGFVVIELKVGRGPDAVAGQILRYKNWIAKHLANGKHVRGIIIAQHISDKIQYAIADDTDVIAKEYELSLKIRDTEKIAL